MTSRPHAFDDNKCKFFFLALILIIQTVALMNSPYHEHEIIMYMYEYASTSPLSMMAFIQTSTTAMQ